MRPLSSLASRWRNLAGWRRRHGSARAAAYAIYRLLDPVLGLRLYRVRVLDLERMPARVEEAPGYAFRFLSAGEVARHAEDPANDLAPEFARRLEDGGHLCFAALRGETLASYTWYAVGTVDPADSSGVPMQFPADSVYAYKAYTRPELRGQHLQGRLKQPVVDALLDRGISRRIALVEWINEASLRTADRSGYRDVGWLVTLGRGPRPLGIASPGPRREGIVFRRRAPRRPQGG